jgi:hypothetical protein
MAAILSRYSFSDTWFPLSILGPSAAASTADSMAMLLRFAAHLLPAEPLGEGAAPAGSTRRDR